MNSRSHCGVISPFELVIHSDWFHLQIRLSLFSGHLTRSTADSVQLTQLLYLNNSARTEYPAEDAQRLKSHRYSRSQLRTSSIFKSEWFIMWFSQVWRFERFRTLQLCHRRVASNRLPSRSSNWNPNWLIVIKNTMIVDDHCLPFDPFICTHG